VNSPAFTLPSTSTIASARALANAFGPLVCASDDPNDPPALLAAQANYDTRAPGWCRCVEGLPGLPKRPPQAYYRDQTSGYHGWMCCTCRKITQTR
jgi:hypothetical protein